MAIISVQGKKLVIPNDDFSTKYWPILSSYIFSKVQNKEVKIKADVDTLLKDCFSILCNQLSSMILNQTKASFFLFCHYIHEESIELWKMQLEGKELDVDGEDLIISRRVLKIILEQSTRNNLTGAANFKGEIDANIDEYSAYLEELLYIGSWCIIMSEFIAKNQLFPNSISLQVDEDGLVILTHETYKALYDFIFTELPKHSSDVVLMHPMQDFKEILHHNFDVKYDELSSFIGDQLSEPELKFSTIAIDQYIKLIVDNLGYNESFVRDFYAGLTVTKNNVLNIEKCILNNQDINRHIYRPFLELNINGEVHHLIGYYKWMESLTTLSTNAFPFGVYPSEWKKYAPIKKFVNRLEDNHDRVLEDPLTQFIADASFVYDINIESLQQPNAGNINISKTIGDIDVCISVILCHSYRRNCASGKRTISGLNL